MLEMCTGCGHISDEKIPSPAFSCCPDRSYSVIPKGLIGILKFKRDKIRLIEKENKSLKEDLRASQSNINDLINQKRSNK